EYLFEFEIRVSYISVINNLMNLLSTTSFHFLNISEINTTTVCSLNGAEYQCWCQHQYFWPCEKCTLYGSCDNVANNSCGCINALPNDGHFCQPANELTYNSTCPSNPVTAEYLIEFKISAPYLSYLIYLLETLSFRFMNIDEMNVTTVCYLQGFEYQCYCKYQYFWSFDKCKTYGFCYSQYDGACTCLNALPSDGQMCVPKSELQIFYYLVEFEINSANTTVINEVKNLLIGTHLPFYFGYVVDILELDLTTVCSLNAGEYQCRCQNYYFWPYEQCSLYGSCDNISSVFCDCINALPNDGHFCQPITSDYLIEFEIDSTDITVLNLMRNYLNIHNLPSINSYTSVADVNITTVCSLNGTEYQCRCEDQYFLPCEKCTQYGSCNNITNSLCGCINAVPIDGHFCQPISELTDNYTCPPISPTVSTTTATKSNLTTNTPPANTSPILSKPSITNMPSPITTTAGTHVLTFTFAINEVFDTQLNDQTSIKYKKYKGAIESSIDLKYKTITGYVANSTKVTNFRPGSVLTDFSIATTSDNLYLGSANEILAKDLRSQGFDVSNNTFSQSVKDRLYTTSGNIYPGTNLTLTCKPPGNNSLTWTLNGGPLPQSNNILELNNASPSDTGQYACTTTVNSLPYVIWQSINIEPYPNIQVTSNKLLQCKDTTVPLQCCVQSVYQVEWDACNSQPPNPVTGCISCDYSVKQTDCINNAVAQAQVTCQLKKPLPESTSESYNSKKITLNIVNKTFDCSDTVFGAGNVGEESTGNCMGGMVGYRVAQCIPPEWDPIEDYCVLPIFKNLQDTAKTLQPENIRQFMVNLSTNALLAIENITASPATILIIVDILNTISSLSQTVLISQPVMKNFLETTDVIGSDGTQSTWVHLNSNSTTQNASSELLKSVERIAMRLSDDNLSIATNFSSLNKTSITAPFSETFGVNSNTQITVPVASAQTSLTVIISSAFNNILPARNLTYNDGNQTGTIINGDVAVIETNPAINSISLSFKINDTTLGNPQCVFWNFNLLNGIGGWDSTGCQLKSLQNETERVTCECSHTTSFSILMSPFTPDKDLAIILDYITYIGVAISLGCLVLCLLIEIIIWKSVTRNDTSYMRHVSIVNIAVSLLIANICFIIGAAVVKQGEGPCSTATFFMHFFYLALFFWMMLSALFLLYRTFMVFSRMTRGSMMAIAFTVGYGAPLIIAVITVASTAGHHGYIQNNYNCWLNWSQTKALLAFVIPALTIVALNFLVLIVVLFKILRRGANASIQPDEKHPLVVIARCVAILTPLFGLTWGFGIGTLVSSNRGIHIVFAFLNSLQGFFILVFGILLDSKVREALAGTFSLRNFSSNRTRNTSGGPSSSGGFPFFQRQRQRRLPSDDDD
ncbi:adhesion G protein-coupled receptor F5-like, partial [Clarias magur]